MVVPTPYFAVTGSDGTFSIPDVVPGEYDLTVFHERATEATLENLRRRIVVTAEAQILPVLRVSESGYLDIPHKNKFGTEYHSVALSL